MTYIATLKIGWPQISVRNEADPLRRSTAMDAAAHGTALREMNISSGSVRWLEVGKTFKSVLFAQLQTCACWRMAGKRSERSSL